jgi:hypothetical protein
LRCLNATDPSPAVSANSAAFREAFQMLYDRLELGASRGQLRVSVETGARAVMSAVTGAALSVISQPDLFGNPTFTTQLREAVIAAVTVAADRGGIGRGRLVVPAQERQSLPAIQSGHEPRRSAAERTATVKHQQRPARRRNIPEPRALEYEAIHGSTQRTWTDGIRNEAR